MTLKDQKWICMKGDGGWSIVIPNKDIGPHGIVTKKNRFKAEVAGLDCPCGPKINWLSRVIIHNSFLENELIEKSITQNFI